MEVERHSCALGGGRGIDEEGFCIAFLRVGGEGEGGEEGGGGCEDGIGGMLVGG